MKIVPVDDLNVAYAVQLAKDMHAMSSFSTDGPEFVWDTTLRNFRRLIHLPIYYFRLAMLDDDSSCGAVLGHVDSFLFNDALFAIEDAWFVMPRTLERAKIGKALMVGFMDWARERGALSIQSGDVASIDAIAVQSLYNHLGFTRYGSIYRRVLGDK